MELTTCLLLFSFSIICMLDGHPFCPDSWVYHDHTATCIKIMDATTSSFDSANNTCRSFNGGSKNQMEGHLIYILDQETDNFVRATAFQPNLICPPSEVGQENSTLTCDVASLGLSNVSWIAIGKFDVESKSKVNCSVTGCTNSTTSMAILEGIATTNQTSVALTMLDVERSDEAKWICSVKFEGVSELFEATCDSKVYVIPEEPTCTHSFGDRSILLECVTNKSYPEAMCSWELHTDDKHMKVKEIQQRETSVDRNDGFYRTICTYEISVTKSGCYNVTVQMHPDVQGHNMSNIFAQQEANFCIVPPEEPPKFYSPSSSELSSYLNTTVGETIVLICNITGGTPPVRKTRIDCGFGIWYSRHYIEKNGESVQTEFKVLSNMDERSCSCKAELVTDEFTLVTSITLSVTYPSSVSSFGYRELHIPFWFTDKPSDKYPEQDRNWSQNLNEAINDRTAIGFECLGMGNPTPRMSIERAAENTKTITLETAVTENLYYEFEATCNASSQYICSAKNELNENTETRTLNLKVNCAFELCNISEYNKTVDVQVNGNVTVAACVYGYPEPTGFSIFRDHGRSLYLARSKYNVSFRYTDERRAKGEITMAVHKLIQSEFGEYQLRVSNGRDANYPSLTIMFKDCPPTHFGKECLQPCPPNCETSNRVSDDRICDSYSGRCSLGCKDGYLGHLCNMTCPNEKYDKNCLKNCTVYCYRNFTGKTSVCHHENGQCLHGCIKGFEGGSCSTLQKEKSTGLISGIGVTSTLLLITTVVIIKLAIWLREMKRSKRDVDQQSGRVDCNDADVPDGNAANGVVDDYDIPMSSLEQTDNKSEETESNPYECIGRPSKVHLQPAGSRPAILKSVAGQETTRKSNYYENQMLEDDNVYQNALDDDETTLSEEEDSVYEN